MSNHSGVLNACYKSIVSTRNKKHLAKCKSMFLCRHAPWCGACPHTNADMRRVFLNKRQPPGASCYICVNNIIIMCIGLVHDIFTRNIYYGIDMKIDN